MTSPQQAVNNLETATGVVSSSQRAMDLVSGGVDAEALMTSMLSNMTDAKQMAANGVVGVPEGMVEKVDIVMQHLDMFARLSDPHFSMLLAKLEQLGKKNEAAMLFGLMVTVKAAILLGESPITPPTVTAATPAAVEAEKSADS